MRPLFDHAEALGHALEGDARSAAAPPRGLEVGERARRVETVPANLMELVEIRGDHFKRSDVAGLANRAHVHACVSQNQSGQLRFLPNVGRQGV